MRKTFMSSLIVTLLLSVGQLALAQGNPQPIAIVSISGVQNVLKDVGTLANIAGMGNEALAVTVMGSSATEAMGIDTKKPIGAVVYLSEAGPTGYAFIPVTNIQKLLDFAKGQHMPINDDGNGNYSVTGPAGNSVALKLNGGWLFAGKSAEDLANVPADPVPMLAGLEKQYTIALRENMQAIPDDFRKMMAEQFVSGVSTAMRNTPDDNPVLMVLKPIIEAQLKQFPKILDETDQTTIGWGVDAAGKKTFIDFNGVAVAGTNLAKKYADAANVTSGFTGFLDAKAAGNLHFSAKMTAEDIESMQESVSILRERANKGIDNSNDIPEGEGKKMVKEIVGQFFDVAKDTVASGYLNDGAMLNLNDKDLSFVAGGFVADGPKLEGAIKKLVELAKNEPDFPGVTFNAESHQGVTFHTTSLPVKEPGGQMVFGPKMDVVIGIGPKAAYVSLGKNPSQALKNAIDKSTSGAAQKVPPAQFAVSVGQLVNFGLQFAPDPTAQAVAAEISKAGDKDHVRSETKASSNGGTTRIELEEGVIRAIGAGVKAQALRQMGGPPGAGGIPQPR